MHTVVCVCAERARVMTMLVWGMEEVWLWGVQGMWLVHVVQVNSVGSV